MVLKNLFKKFNIIPNDLSLFLEAITHPSFANEIRDVSHYQRLEFLGDAILELKATTKVFMAFPTKNEGEMTIIRAKAVSGEMLSQFAKKIGLDKIFRLGKNSEELRSNPKILADLFEAFVAAIFLDQGEEKLDEFLENNVYEFILNSKNKELKNPKTILQEFLQSESREAIEYETKASKKGFWSKIRHEGTIFGYGNGKTKKEAEVKAAEDALDLLTKNVKTKPQKTKGEKWN